MTVCAVHGGVSQLWAMGLWQASPLSPAGTECSTRLLLSPPPSYPGLNIVSSLLLQVVMGADAVDEEVCNKADKPSTWHLSTSSCRSWLNNTVSALVIQSLIKKFCVLLMFNFFLRQLYASVTFCNSLNSKNSTSSVCVCGGGQFYPSIHFLNTVEWFTDE